MIIQTENDFIEKYVTDALYRRIIRELRTNPDGTRKEDIGRKRELTREILRHYLFVLSMTGEYEFSAESAGLPEKRRQKYMTESDSFRGVSSLAKNNVSLRSRMAVAQSIMGRKPSYYKLIHPVTNQPTYIELKEVTPNINAAMWWLEKVDKIGIEESKEDPYKNPRLGCPRNEEEAQLLKELLKWHTDYIVSKEKEVKRTDSKSEPT
ncbi:hypothetical protein HYU92_02530 [Candidatus Curtissbacteria bacterium]|nr:hypothetical protein [Candidatus Curtissbacteria bacterium]